MLETIEKVFLPIIMSFFYSVVNLLLTISYTEIVECRKNKQPMLNSKFFLQLLIKKKKNPGSPLYCNKATEIFNGNGQTNVIQSYSNLK